MEAALGDWVRKQRRAVGFTQEDLAGRAGVSVRALRDIEQNRVRRPQERSVRRLVAALPVSDAERASVPGAGAGPGSLSVGVLGPLSVRRDGIDVDAGKGLPRSLLGLLALRPHRSVPYEEIVDVLWADRPPRTCLNLVHVYVAQVRRLLEPGRPRRAPARTVVRSRGGYLLDLPDEHLDTARFGALLGAARVAPDRRAARDRYARALACWRGPVAADLDAGLRRHPAAVALAQDRLAATLAYADLALGSEANDAAIARLRELTPAEPLHEGLHARLMLALAASGERVAALDLFADVRDRLAENLGIEAGPELRAAHVGILRAEGPAPGRPAQLPADVATFTGRVEHLRRLDAHGPGVVVLTGAPGVGKTALAVHWAHRVRDRYPDGQLYLDLRGYAVEPPVAARAALTRFLRAVGVPAGRVPADVEEAAGMYRSLLADRRVLVVLDNAGHPDQVRPLLPGSAHCLALVTSRNDLGGLLALDGARRLPLDVFTPAEARTQLERVLGRDRVAAEPGAAADLARLCGYLPLALCVAEAHLAGRPLGEVVDRLRDGDRLAELAVDGDSRCSVRAAFALSYEPLPAAARRLFRLLGLVPGPDVTVSSAAALAGVGTPQAAHLLRQLAAAHLVTQRAPGRFACPHLLRSYAAERSRAEDADNHRWAALRRLASHARTRRISRRPTG